MTKNMTEGSPMKLILGFSIPMLFGMLFQQFYNLVDTMIVGKTLGVDALAGVNKQYQFYDYWFLHGRVRRICDSRGTAVWCAEI